MAKNALKTKRGRPVNEARREEIIATAGRMFGEKGFHATRMEHIAKELGISKLTLYSRFEDKHHLFSQVIAAKCQEYIPDDLFDNLERLSVEESLSHVATRLIMLLTSDAAIGMERMLMGIEPEERAKLTKLFYEAGPSRVKAKIGKHLEHLHKEKKLAVPDPAFSTHVFASLIKGSDIVMRTQMGIPPVVSDKQKKEYAQRVVKLFIAAHTYEHETM